MKAVDIRNEICEKNLETATEISEDFRNDLEELIQKYGADDDSIWIVCRFVLRKGKSFADASFSYNQVGSDFSNAYDQAMLDSYHNF